MGIASWPPVLGDANPSDAAGATVLERCCSFPRDVTIILTVAESGQATFVLSLPG